MDQEKAPQPEQGKNSALEDRGGRDHRWQEAENVLCIRLDAMGDVLMTTPAIRALKESLPNRKITLLTSSAGARIAGLVPEIDEVIVFDPPWMKATDLRPGSRADFEMVRLLSAARFDAAVIFTVFSQNPLPAAYMAYLAEIPLRLAHCRENPYQMLTDWVPEADHFGEADIRHEVQRQLDLVSAIGCTNEDEQLSLSFSEEAEKRVAARLRDAGLALDRPWVVVHPGASAPSRRYPKAGFIQAAEKLIGNFGIQIVFTGIGSERELVEDIRSALNGHTWSLAGELNLEEFSALISLSPLLISNNTGPVHMAAALQTPVVDIYALTNPQHTPWQVPHRLLYHDVPCKFCYKSICPLKHHNCLQLVPPEAVVDAAVDLLNSPS